MIRNIFCVVVAVVWTAVCFPLVMLPMMLTWRISSSFFFVQHVWSPVLLWAGGATLSVRGLENVDRTKPFIVVSNHQSTIDIPVLFMAIPYSLRFVAKKSLSYVPLLGWYMLAARFIFVDRGNRRDAFASLEKAAKQIRDGVSIISFAEGTRSHDLTILPFKKGSFALALQAGVPIIPVAIEGSGQLMPKDSWNITPGPIKVNIGKAIDVRAFGDDRDGLLNAVRSTVIDLHVEIGGKGGTKTQTTSNSSGVAA